MTQSILSTSASADVQQYPVVVARARAAQVGGRPKEDTVQLGAEALQSIGNRLPELQVQGSSISEVIRLAAAGDFRSLAKLALIA